MQEGESMTTRWRINVYRVPPANHDDDARAESGEAGPVSDDAASERDWRYADAVYEDVM
jgi:hypothetical protein